MLISRLRLLQQTPLPFKPSKLAPFLSAETIAYHYGKHHNTYIQNLNTVYQENADNLIEIIEKNREVGGPIFNNAAQIFNHDFYWQSLTDKRIGTKYSCTDFSTQEKRIQLYLEDECPIINNLLIKSFGSYNKFAEQFKTTSLKHFGSGWIWLMAYKNPDSITLKIVDTHDANVPWMTTNQQPLLVCDVWEHAYYIDHRNQRNNYVSNWFEIANWKFAESQVQKLQSN